MGGDSSKYKALRQMLLSRRLLLLLDGIDEGGNVKRQIEEHVTQHLQPQGHVMVVTSRPAGLTEELYGSFEKLQLCPLSLDQQLKVVNERLADVHLEDHAAQLRTYVEEQVPRDSETEQRITGNPLMLSMVCSIFESQKQEAKQTRVVGSSASSGMPGTMVELYEHAVTTLLEQVRQKGRAGMAKAGNASNEQLLGLLQVIALDAHQDTKVAGGSGRRLLTEPEIEEALSQTRSIEYDSAKLLWAEVKGLVEKGAFPLLTLMSTSPLEMQFSHLSFQEFLATRELCHGRPLPKGESQLWHATGKLPWQWGAWWKNVMKMGCELDLSFSRALDRFTQLDANGTTTVTLSGSCNTIGCRALTEVLKVNTALLVLKLSSAEVGAADAASLLRGLSSNLSSAIQVIDLSDNKIGSITEQSVVDEADTSEALRHEDPSLQEFVAALDSALSVLSSSLLDVDLRGNGLIGAAAENVAHI
eukprot:2416811-Prymnesium_polylepis.1